MIGNGSIGAKYVCYVGVSFLHETAQGLRQFIATFNRQCYPHRVGSGRVSSHVRRVDSGVHSCSCGIGTYDRAASGRPKQLGDSLGKLPIRAKQKRSIIKVLAQVVRNEYAQSTCSQGQGESEDSVSSNGPSHHKHFIVVGRSH